VKWHHSDFLDILFKEVTENKQETPWCCKFYSDFDGYMAHG